VKRALNATVALQFANVTDINQNGITCLLLAMRVGWADAFGLLFCLGNKHFHGFGNGHFVSFGVMVRLRADWGGQIYANQPE
jgi:hypothetical protein